MIDLCVAPELRGLHPLLARLVKLTGATVLDADSFDAWALQAGPAMVIFAQDPADFNDRLDLAAVVPELRALGGRRFRVALLPPAAAQAIAPRYELARWPAFVMLRDGRYLGAAVGGWKPGIGMAGARVGLMRAPRKGTIE